MYEKYYGAVCFNPIHVRPRMLYLSDAYIAGLVVNYGISNTIVLEIP